MNMYTFYLKNGEILELQARDFDQALNIANKNSSGELVTHETEVDAYIVKN